MYVYLYLFIAIYIYILIMIYPHQCSPRCSPGHLRASQTRITTWPGGTWVGSVSNKHNPSATCIRIRIAPVIHVAATIKLTIIPLEPFVISPCRCFSRDMHGLINQVFCHYWGNPIEFFFHRLLICLNSAVHLSDFVLEACTCIPAVDKFSVSSLS